ncbi:MAG: efflux RND transporter permease subunit [Defluviicoccus sp.]|nr:efflux RND transporter permease subunit [Defluviicoccus sp.]MDE0384884.1 efflux RND transporter permease subunit [Defluviicoccus sp.]
MFGKNLIRLFVRHRNAANLLMALIFVAGIYSLSKLNTQFFPDFGLDIVSIRVDWPGASTGDVEANVVAAIEPEIRFLDHVEKVTSYATEGVGRVVVEYQAGTDMQSAVSEAEAALQQITILPEDSERPVVRRIIRYDTIVRLVLSGPYSEAVLKRQAKRMRDQLLAAGIDRVTFFGARDEEIRVEIEPRVLRQLDLTPAAVAARIEATNRDIPSGSLEGSVEKQLRSVGLHTTSGDIGSIEIRSLGDGQKIYLRDIANVSEAFDDKAPIGLRNGRPAIELHVQRSPTADALKVGGIVDRFLVEARGNYPPQLEIERYDEQAGLIEQRVQVLLNNGASGLVLVLAVLLVFLNGRTAFWVAAGIPTAFMAALATMLALGESINMVTLFALIMTLGLIVDDTIVVGEHAAARREAGLGPRQAAEAGALRMLAPVMAASLTTIAAFLPLVAMGGIIGQIVGAIPLVVVAVILASLVECFLVLPGHLRESLKKHGGRRNFALRRFDAGFDWFRAGPFQWLIRLCVRWRYATLAMAIAVFLVSAGLMLGGRVGFHFFPSPEADVVVGNVVMAPGTPRRDTGAMVQELSDAVDRAVARFGVDSEDLVAMSFGSVGRSGGRQFSRIVGDQYGGLTVELVPSDRRKVRTEDFIEAWRNEIRRLPNVEQVNLNARAGGPPGREIDIRLRGGSADDLKAAATEVKRLLSRFPGVSTIDDDLPYGKQELILEVTPRGQALGFTTQSAGLQVRNAFQGAIAQRFARGDEEVTIKVRYPRASADSAAFLNLFLRAPDGTEVPLSEVVTLSQERGFSRLRREDGAREVAITGEIDETVTSLGALLPAIAEGGLADIVQRYGLSYRFKGKAEEQAESARDMGAGAITGLIAIYIVLAWVFANFSRPLIVMAIIPFGFVGTVLGHLALGFDVTILSMIGLLGLSGILVNNSIILVRTVDLHIDDETPLHEAIVLGCRERLRPVLLTSLTTIGGLVPLLFETSLQAQFLIPMAITIVFGLAVATLIVLVLTPALLAIDEDIRRIFRRRAPRPAQAAG